MVKTALLALFLIICGCLLRDTQAEGECGKIELVVSKCCILGNMSYTLLKCRGIDVHHLIFKKKGKHNPIYILDQDHLPSRSSHVRPSV